MHSAQARCNASSSGKRRLKLWLRKGKAFAALTADQANETASMTDIFIFMSFASVRQHGCARKSNDRESQRNVRILHCPDAAVPVENVPALLSGTEPDRQSSSYAAIHKKLYLHINVKMSCNSTIRTGI